MRRNSYPTKSPVYIPSPKRKKGWPRKERPVNLHERFWEKVQRTTLYGCWIWTASVSKTGTPTHSLQQDKKTVTKSARHVAYYLTTGQWAEEGVKIFLKCENQLCVNPRHFYLKRKPQD